MSVLAQERPLTANSDPVYRALRDAGSAEAYRVENIELKRDAATLTLKTGQIAFLAPVLNHIFAAVFVGEGQFRLKPALPLEEDYLARVTGQREVSENITSAVLYFTDSTPDEVKQQARSVPLDPQAANLLKDFRRRMRQQNEHPHSMLEALTGGDDIPNLEAEILGELYNPAEAGSFRVYMRGVRDPDLRFLMIPRGAMPMMPSPEEVALLNFDDGGDRDGIWYLSHTIKEWDQGRASSEEDKRLAKAEHYKLDTTVSTGRTLTASAELRFRALTEGVRVLHISLLPSLRVSRVTAEDGKDVPFIQENQDGDGSFHIVLPEPLVRGTSRQLRIEYTGNRVITNEGSGNFAVGARTSWYPSLNPFTDRATYDLTFKVPKAFTLVSVGKLAREVKEGDFTVTQWSSEIPLAVAGFNYGLFTKKEVVDPQTKYQIEVYTSKEVPDYLKSPEFIRPLGSSQLEDGPSRGTMSPSQMAGSILSEGESAVRVFEHYFGAAPYGRIALTQQPQFNFGQSWPTLVYLPLSAFLDSTQRWSLLGSKAFKFAAFIQEVTPHEVAHQWWGHMVGWSTYHDQWLSEGFADFSAALFLESTEKPDQVSRYWDRQRDAILQKNSFGIAPNDIGPLWMGLRLNTPKSAGAYNRLVYPKGAYILQMLRSMMWDPNTGDQDFIAMMKDFVQTRLHQNASTEGFKAIAEKHIKPAMDLEGNHRLDWFFRDWIYGTEVPSYRMEYSTTPTSGGKVMFNAKLTQSGVSQSFVMRVPIYMDFDGRLARAGTTRLAGSGSVDIKVELPKKPKRVLLNANHDVLAAESVVKQLQ